ncbi:MAG: hypothetical protein AAFV33_25430, partial [Chloroflexota bacterium]
YALRIAEHIELFQMQNGSGDDMHIIFSNTGTVIKGFDHESSISPHAQTPPEVYPGILDSMPPDLAAHRAEPAFKFEDTTFCVWRLTTDSTWQVGEITTTPVVDGSDGLMWILDGDPKTYARWAEDYYEQKIDLAIVQWIYGRQPVTNAMVKALNPANSHGQLADELAGIKYER